MGKVPLHRHRASLLLLQLLCPAIQRAAASAALTGCVDGGQWGSSLFGCDGNQWNQRGPFIDWSFAGYQAGSEGIPDVPVVRDVVKDCGARGDNVTDDTRAFLRGVDAVRDAGGGALSIPPGVYRISRPLLINNGGIVLRGAGQDKTILRFQKPLTEVYSGDPKATLEYTWLGGLITVFGAQLVANASLATVVAPAARATQVLSLSATEGIRPDSWIAVRQSHSASQGELSRHLYGGLLPPAAEMELPGKDTLLFISQVVSVDMASGTVVLQRPLPHDVRPEWGAQVVPFVPDVQGVGIESLSIVFPDHVYQGEAQEAGWNGIFFHTVANCWVRDVHVHNAENAINLRRSHFSTVRNVQITTSDLGAGEGAVAGHMALAAAVGGSNLFTNFTIGSKYQYDLFMATEVGTVFANGTAVDLRPQPHMLQPYAILLSNINGGAGTRLFNWRGTTARSFPARGEASQRGAAVLMHGEKGKQQGAHSAAYSSFWNIRTDRAVDFFSSAATMGPKLNIIGVQLSRERNRKLRGGKASAGPDFWEDMQWNVEEPPSGGKAMPTKELQPRCLYEAMVQLRATREARAEGGFENAPSSPAAPPTTATRETQQQEAETSNSTCHYTVGEWVPRGDVAPLYDPEHCSQVVLNDKQFDCKGVAPNQQFADWIWKPNSCSMPEVTADYLAAKLQGRKILYVGDSISRNAFYGGVCTIESVLRGKYEVKVGSRGCPPDIAARFGAEVAAAMIASKECDTRTVSIPQLNSTITWVDSYYLCSTVNNTQDCLKPAAVWPLFVNDSNVVIFNTGHHWNFKKGFRKAVNQVLDKKVQEVVNWTSIEEDSMPPGLSWVSLRKRIMKGTVKADPGLVEWMRTNRNPEEGHQEALNLLLEHTRDYKGKLFYHAVSPKHFSTGTHLTGSCADQTRPWSSEEAVFKDFSIGMYIFELERFMRLFPRWRVLDTLRMTVLRPDAHPSSALRATRPTSSIAEDCSHYCLGTAPDWWFRLLLTELD